MIRIGNKEYKMPVSWLDLNLNDAERVNAIIMPEAMKQRYIIIMESKEVEKDLLQWSEDVNFEDITPYVKRVIESLLWVDSVTLEKTYELDLLNIYFQYLEKFVIGINYLGSNFVPNDITSFTLDKVTYELPKEKIIMGQIIPLESMNMAQYCECADLINLIEDEGGLKFLSYAIACLALPKGVEYSEDLVLLNGEKFKELDMQTALDVFFCSINLVNTYELDILSYSAKVTLKRNTPRNHQGLKSTDGSGISLTLPITLYKYLPSVN